MVSGPTRGLLAAFAIIVHIGCNEAQVSLPFQCSFESDDMCGMTQRTDDQFDWTRRTGPTPSRPSGTGPYNASGGDYYLYIEGSDHGDGESAIIETPPLTFTGAICVQFWYHMYTLNPSHMGRLVVFTGSQGEGNPLLHEGGENKGDHWILEQITVSAFTTGDRIVFLNEERDYPRGDMALDMIDIRGGACDACSLNNGGCDTHCVPDGEGRLCECHVGYHLDADGVTCFDIDECAPNGGKGDCGHQCNNTPGSYRCDCNSGYTLNGDQKSCDDIDECVPNGGKGDCSHQCNNTDGSYRCDCNSGYTLNGDQKSCDAIKTVIGSENRYRTYNWPVNSSELVTSRVRTTREGTCAPVLTTSTYRTTGPRVQTAKMCIGNSWTPPRPSRHCVTPSRHTSTSRWPRVSSTPAPRTCPSSCMTAMCAVSSCVQEVTSRWRRRLAPVAGTSTSWTRPGEDRGQRTPAASHCGSC